MPDPGYALARNTNLESTLAQRTAHKEAAFILPYLRQNSRVLDVGCGPGSITCDFATLIPNGFVIGIDVSAATVESARLRGKEQNLNNIDFRVGNIMHGLTEFADGEFDIVFCHQLLIHVSDPVAAMREMKRLAKSREGVVAVRESLTVLWYPTNSVLERLTDWFPRAFRAASAVGEDVGEKLPHAWARCAGFDGECIVNGVSTMTTSTRLERETAFKRLQGMMANGSSFRENMVKAGATQNDFDEIMKALEDWRDNEDGWNSWLSCETICTSALGSVATKDKG